MSLSEAIRLYLDQLRRENASPHTQKNYASDLEQLLTYFQRSGDPQVADIDILAIREWMGHLYESRLSAVSLRRKLACLRSLFRFLHAQWMVKNNPANLIRTPKAPRRYRRCPPKSRPTGLSGRWNKARARRCMASATCCCSNCFMAAACA